MSQRNKKQNRIEEPNQNNQQQNLSGTEETTPITDGGEVANVINEEAASSSEVVDSLDLGDDSTIGDPAVE